MKSSERHDLDFAERKQAFVDSLQKPENRIMALATSDGGHVTARSILTASVGTDIYFFSWTHSRKCRQIRSNPHVALCNDQLQVEGTAEILGGFFEETNRSHLELFLQKFPEAIERWRDRPGMVFVRVRPTFVVLGASSTIQPGLDYLDLEKGVAYSEPWAHY
jgi:uncharacterized pyridoxamine 5'-phosphate oxidase family protein